ncbi:MAG: type I restriction enzyme HsdR N-terminal domain-containing protein [Bacteroidetes bacterium]|nr:type I restriction enzyme HsdR N-terminal domain-containing protein [Bacteroidota bacterium]
MLALYPDLSVPALRSQQGREEIFDPCRRKWVALTPEEWTRQRLLQQFIEVLHVPAGWIAVEKEIDLNGLRKRYDILVHDASGAPQVLIECKAPEVPLQAAVMEQLLRYHIRIPVPYLIIANGSEIRCWERLAEGLQECSDWPRFRK